MAELAADFRVIDADTHFTEPPDLWTKRAPKGYQDRVLHIEDIDGLPTWVVDGAQLGFARGGGGIGRHGEKVPFVDSQTWGLDRVHQGAWDPKVRLEVMDYELWENAPAQAAERSRMPSEYFKHNWYATFWFEKNQGDLQGLMDKVGEDNVLFETDFPHPTCLYPAPLETMAAKMDVLRPETRRKVMGVDAAKLYRL